MTHDTTFTLHKLTVYTSLLIDEPAARSMELPLGDTVISSTARDEAGNLGECVFTVTVTREYTRFVSAGFACSTFSGWL